ncbi:hypothetical protein PVK06_046415 [Gossypium arboreum]|uniref:Uncharacterized protein n=1 Tax=Gossypium arboreum TaxID=29729 RepID=A0ABR0MAY7_GOSAR|nr:hypothetical protein PVK06_046415 [Gossypium arboreum]
MGNQWIFGGINGCQDFRKERLSFHGQIDTPLPRRVAELIVKEERVWDLSSTVDYLVEEEAEAIKEIQISGTGDEDRMVWPYNEDRMV